MWQMLEIKATDLRKATSDFGLTTQTQHPRAMSHKPGGPWVSFASKVPFFGGRVGQRIGLYQNGKVMYTSKI